jgi:hypothetical protein
MTQLARCVIHRAVNPRVLSYMTFMTWRASCVYWPYASAFDYYREHGVPIRVARIFNTYGPRMVRAVSRGWRLTD